MGQEWRARCDDPHKSFTIRRGNSSSRGCCHSAVTALTPDRVAAVRLLQLELTHSLGKFHSKQMSVSHCHMFHSRTTLQHVRVRCVFDGGRHFGWACNTCGCSVWQAWQRVELATCSVHCEASRRAVLKAGQIKYCNNTDRQQKENTKHKFCKATGSKQNGEDKTTTKRESRRK